MIVLRALISPFSTRNNSLLASFLLFSFLRFWIGNDYTDHLIYLRQEGDV